MELYPLCLHWPVTFTLYQDFRPFGDPHQGGSAVVDRPSLNGACCSRVIAPRAVQHAAWCRNCLNFPCELRTVLMTMLIGTVEGCWNCSAAVLDRLRGLWQAVFWVASVSSKSNCSGLRIWRHNILFSYLEMRETYERRGTAYRERNASECLPSAATAFVPHEWRTQEFFRRGGEFNKFSWGQRTERTGIWGRSPLVRGSGGNCNLVQEISFHTVKFS